MDGVSDRLERDLAETTFDRNVVVLAGAGTGKTTLLVNRLIHLLVKEPEPVPITRIVALTFTNKAATEMKVRLRERLTTLIRSAVERGGSGDGGAVSVAMLRDRYHLSTDEIGRRAAAALHELERAQIGTLHSFAAHLLRLYPLESGLDPAFREDDGSRFEEHFIHAWAVWLDRELSAQGSQHSLWRAILGRTTVEDLRLLAWALCSELVDLDVLPRQATTSQCGPVLVQWLEEARSRVQALVNRYAGPKRRKIDDMLTAADSLLTAVLDHGADAVGSFPEVDRARLEKDLGTIVAGWEKADFKEAGRLIDTAKSILDVDHAFFVKILKLLSPLASEIRSSFIAQGWLSFDALLARARTLLHDHRAVRERVKQDCRAVLVDEFQDTDPIQYEIILAVSEQQGRHATAWQDMVLEPGKLFVVGDPKQSIYAFRRADIEAFDRVVHKIESEQGIVATLAANFRSDAAVIAPVNDVFDRLFERKPHVQPPNVRLEGHRNRQSLIAEPGVRLRIVVPQQNGEPFDAAGATRAEGEAIARWIKEDALTRPSVKPGHVALLFRKLTEADRYLDALRRHGIPYTIEGEKHFYRRQEVIDLINVLRVLVNPHDAVALMGILRSPLGGLTDRELYDLRQACDFSLVALERLQSWSHPRATAVRRLYVRLSELSQDVTTLTLPEAVQLVFDRLGALEVAAASLHGEQAVANLLKVKQTAAALSDRPHLTLGGFVELMAARLDDQPDEAESPLAEESADAIQVLTIHKAKGLEFPIVILPGLHQGAGAKRPVPTVLRDWSSGEYGLSLGDSSTIGSILIQEKFAVREEAERRRLLYVGMTRAKDLLILSGGVTGRSSGESMLDLLGDIATGEIGEAATGALTIGSSSLPHIVVEAPERKRPRRPVAALANPVIDLVPLAEFWKVRTRAWTVARDTPLQLTPTGMSRRDRAGTFRRAPADNDSDVGRLIGILAHRLLEQWDFADDPSRFTHHIARAIETFLAPNQQHQAATLTVSLREMFASFARSNLYARLRSATILGREIPFVLPWGECQVMEGVIDVLYRFEESLWIADYKTDAVTSGEAAARAERYRAQSEVYKAAAARSLGIAGVRFHCLFLRCATAVEL